MVDFIKILIIDKATIDKLVTHPLLIWRWQQEDLDNDYETIKTIIKKQFNGILFNFYSNKLEILFKPHYYFNNNRHNANDFTVLDSINTFKILEDLFQIDLKNAKVMSLEFGINIISPIDVKDLVTYFKYHGRNPFLRQDRLRYSKISSFTNAKGKTNAYKIIKVYAKALQLDEELKRAEFIDENTLRFEIKSKKRTYIKTLGVNTVADLLKLEVYARMQEAILQEFNKVLILDYNAQCMNKKDQETLSEMNNPDYWYRLENETYRNKFNNFKKKYYQLINQDKNNLKTNLKKIIESKLKSIKNVQFNTIV